MLAVPQPTDDELQQLRQLGQDVMSDDDLKRHWFARNGVLRRAKRDVAATAKWRQTMPKHSYEDCKPQLQSLSSYVHGFDSEGNCNIYMFSKRDPPGTASEKVATIIFNIEEAIKMMDRHKQEGRFVARKVNYIVDLNGFTLSNSSRDLTVSKQWGTIVTKYYPSILRSIYLLNYPRSFKFFWSLCKPFASEEEQSFVKWVPPSADPLQYFVSEGFKPEWLETQVGGSLEPATYINTPSNVGCYKPFFETKCAADSDNIEAAVTLSFIDCETSSWQEEEDDDEFASPRCSTFGDSHTDTFEPLESSIAQLMPSGVTFFIRNPVGQILEISKPDIISVTDIIRSNIPKGKEPAAFSLSHESVAISTDEHLLEIIQSSSSSVVLNVVAKKRETCCLVM
eukprot:TRINITY_DN11829_c0_g1_i1.p1 TRINITY_DN11829_c0_g1~~TRINITY_DN11829_c0_g1_i1.p1  ORF type:complete len:396 (+),score=84.34 TRINITY_DN11829_c0_g1_i1:28-1215(+)